MRHVFSKILSHIAAWAAFLAIPALLFPRPSGGGPARPPDIPTEAEPAQAFFFVTLNLLLICFFYLNYLVLIPRLWTRQRRWWYFGCITGCFLLLQTLIFVLNAVVLSQFLPDMRQHFNHNMGMFASLVMFALAWAASSGIRLSAEWKKAEDRRRESENARLNAELTQLKSQLNPHFLFNTLHGIYTLALAKNDAAPDAVLKLSYLLRYVMAETNVDFVPLERDLEHLRHFVALHQMRLTAKTPVSFKVEGDLSAHRIAPLLLLPFVENAFKFGTSAREESPIDISVKIEGNVLEFICQNHIRSTISDSTGIGIANTRRRLDLLYAGRYVLEIRERAGLFRVELKIGM